jgi:PAS domain S-box-containing protein
LEQVVWTHWIQIGVAHGTKSHQDTRTKISGVETITKRRSWSFLGTLQRSYKSYVSTKHSFNGVTDGTLSDISLRHTDRVLLGVSCALLALLLAGLLARFSDRSIFCSFAVIGGSGVCFVLGATIDAVHRRRQAARQARARLQRLISAQPAALVALVTPDGQICYASPSFRAILGIDPALVLDKSALQHVHPADRSKLTSHFARIWSGGVDQAAFRLRHADGTWRWIEAHGARTGNHHQAALVLVGHDITERRAHRTEVERCERLQRISHMTGTVAHDLNNLLTGIAGIATLDMQTLPPDHELYRDLASISHATSQAATLIRQLRSLTRPLHVSPRALDLNGLVQQLVHFIERLLGPNITVCLALAPNLAPVWGDSSLLEQVVLNVAINARDAMPGGGRLQIGTTNLASGAEDLGLDACQQASYVRLSISDTGTGMDAATQRRMFEPYFTTKAPGCGSGLGLATCAEIIQQHGGSIQVESYPGHGTTVTIDLPCGSQDQTLGRTRNVP